MAERSLLAAWGEAMTLEGQSPPNIEYRIQVVARAAVRLGCDPAEFDAGRLADYLGEFPSGSASTYRTALRHWHRWLTTEGHRRDDPTPVAPRSAASLPDHELLAAWVLWMRAAGLATRTIGDRVTTIRAAARVLGCDPAAFDAPAIAEYLAAYPNPSSKLTKYAVFKCWQQWLVRQGHRVDDPSTLLAAPKRPRGEPRPIPDASLERLLACAAGNHRAVVVLAAYGLLRSHEIARIRGEDVDANTGTLRVLGKGGTDRTIAMHPLVAELAAKMPRRGPWFPSPQRPGEPVSRHWVIKRFSEAAAAAGIESTAHPCRHWGATTMLRNGADLRSVQVALRHASIATTELYTQVSDNTRHAAIRRLPTFGHTAPSERSPRQPSLGLLATMLTPVQMRELAAELLDAADAAEAR